jgi:cholera toxin transcriptional activator
MTDSSFLEPVDAMHRSANVYLGKDIFFDPRAAELVSAAATVALNFREGILLQLLLGGRVKKQTVIEAAWGDNGVVVTEASYHQLVRSLRKKFAEIGLPVNAIKTLPRFGLEYLLENSNSNSNSKPNLETELKLASPDQVFPGIRLNIAEKNASVIRPGPRRGTKWLMQMLLVICPLIVGIFIGHLAYRGGQTQMRIIANDFGIHLFDLGNTQFDANLMREIKNRSNRGEYVYISRTGQKAWLNVCAGPVQANFSFCRQDHFSLY